MNLNNGGHGDSIECADSEGTIRGVLVGKADQKRAMIASLENWIKDLREQGGRGQNYIYITEKEANELIALLKGGLVDARLISTVLELAEALRGLLNALPSATTHPAIKAARAALAKVEAA